MMRTLPLVAAATLLLTGCGTAPEEEVAAIERGILETPGAQELWHTIKAEYPDAFAGLVSEIRAMDLEARGDAARIETVGAQWLQRFFADIALDAVIAPPPELIDWSAAESDLYRVLADNSQDQCANMTMGEWIVVGRQESELAGAIAQRNAAMVRAAAAGRDDPHTYAEPDQEDFAALGDAIAATGLDPELQARLGSDEAMQALSPEDQCAIGVAVYSALAKLPDDAEPRMAAYMLAPD